MADMPDSPQTQDEDIPYSEVLDVSDEELAQIEVERMSWIQEYNRAIGGGQ